MKKITSIILIISICLVNFIVVSQTNPTSEYVYSFSRPEGSLSLNIAFDSNGNAISSGNYYSSSGLCFNFVIDPKFQIASIMFAKGNIDIRTLESGLYQIKIQKENGRSAIVTLGKDGNPQNPNSLSQFQNVLQELYPNLQSCASSFMTFGSAYNLWKTSPDGSLSLDTRTFIEEVLSPHVNSLSGWGCALSVVGVVVSTAGMIVGCASGV